MFDCEYIVVKNILVKHRLCPQLFTEITRESNMKSLCSAKKYKENLGGRGWKAFSCSWLW
jgi:hypothetical protein